MDKFYRNLIKNRIKELDSEIDIALNIWMDKIDQQSKLKVLEANLSCPNKEEICYKESKNIIGSYKWFWI